MKKIAVALMVSVLIAAATASSAAASRLPTPGEHAQLAATANTVPPCVDARVATVQAGWARVQFTNVDGCPQGNGLAVLQFATGNWATRYNGPDDPVGPCTDIDGVPAAVALDLALCRALSKRVYIPRGDHVVYKPRLIIYGAHAGLLNLRWQGWGRGVATARGVMDYSDRTLTFRAPIRVRVSQIKPCGIKRTYLRMTVTFDRASDRRKYTALDGVTSFRCP